MFSVYLNRGQLNLSCWVCGQLDKSDRPGAPEVAIFPILHPTVAIFPILHPVSAQTTVKSVLSLSGTANLKYYVSFEVTDDYLTWDSSLSDIAHHL